MPPEDEAADTEQVLAATGKANDEAPPPKAVTTEDNFWKRQAEKHQKELARRDKESLTETERLRAEKAEADKRAEAAEQEVKRTKRNFKIDEAFAKAGAHNARIARRAADLDEMTVDENGKLVGGNLDRIIQQTKKDHPYLFKADNNGGGVARTNSGSGGAARTGVQASTNKYAALDEQTRGLTGR